MCVFVSLTFSVQFFNYVQKTQCSFKQQQEKSDKQKQQRVTQYSCGQEMEWTESGTVAMSQPNPNAYFTSIVLNLCITRLC